MRLIKDKGRYVPPTISETPASSLGLPTLNTLVSTLGKWAFRRSTLWFRPLGNGPAGVLSLLPGFWLSRPPMVKLLDFGASLKDFCQQFLVPLSIPPSRRAYASGNDIHMSDLPVRFMVTSNGKLQASTHHAFCQNIGATG